MNFIPSITYVALVLSALMAEAQTRNPGGGDGARPPRGMPMREERKIVAQFDQDKNERLDAGERAAALEFLKKNPAPQRGPMGMGGKGRPGGQGPFGIPNPFGGGETKVVSGKRVSPDDVKPAASADLYDAATLRTIFIQFENDQWESELEAFHGTDVELPATLIVDGKSYPGVGIHFRGMSSYMMVPAGRKRSFNVSMDSIDDKQRLNGVKTLNLLNSNGDASFLSAVLFSHIARKHIAAPKVNLVRVVINGENWGVYVNQEQFNKDFIKANYQSKKGARWKVPGSPNGRGGLDYIGDDIAAYKERYEMKSGNADDWHALIRLCKTISETPVEKLESALEPMLDVDGVLWFLALDCALMNSDGYWTRASDYSLYRDKKGRFHVIPADMNEAFRSAEGGPGGRPPGGMRPGGFPDGPPPEMPEEKRVEVKGVALDPLVALDDESKPLRSKLLHVPALRDRYLTKVRTIAEMDLDWKNLGPIVAAYRELMKVEVEEDTRKLATTEEFMKCTANEAGAATEASAPVRRGPGHGGMPLRAFADQRRAFLLADSRVKDAPVAD